MTSSFYKKGGGRQAGSVNDIAAEVYFALQANLASVRRSDEHVLLVGDFNARLASSANGVRDIQETDFDDLSHILGQDSSALIHGYPVLEIVQTLLAMSLAWRSVKFAEARACVYLMVTYVGMRMAT